MSVFSKLAKLASSPQGKAALAKARAAADDPKNRAKIDDLVGKVKAKGGRPASSSSSSSSWADSTDAGPTTPGAPASPPVAAPATPPVAAPASPPVAAPASPPATGTTSAEQVHPPRP